MHNQVRWLEFSELKRYLNFASFSRDVNSLKDLLIASNSSRLSSLYRLQYITKCISFLVHGILDTVARSLALYMTLHDLCLAVSISRA